MTDTATDSTGRKPAGALFVVATPIGNLQDLSPRAAACLRDADLLLAEDTRHTRTLLDACGIARPASAIESLHEHNERERVPALVSRLQAGARIALVTDAGTPLLSDPGSLLVTAVARAGIEVVALPGPCAAIAALSIAGLATDRFVFEGFLPARATARREALGALAHETRTLVFYEAPHRLEVALQDMATAFGAERAAAVAREITKRFEHVYRGTLATLASLCATDANMTRGEIVLVVAGAPRKEDEDAEALAAADTLKVLLQELPVSQAARIAARLTGRSRKELYERALALAPPKPGE
ncbi:MAG: 16S rRNA (cytidine(1402)-2'-O)-methyltransferase [Gammaproteobacteria bacterium]|nr:16S rRNA (cytidine(1402)-2'-O)-methyltransferase [Gammaproteobacteria bacterium]MDH4311887.1 16S rRNA (cytidine(1402)-2'-O)-methyltransferase [Gammaproteobacteria bacterium]MDH5272351.1 16S rRNA (cytidine(1402)-2'-O)-methyltransferase [Gammaproteobacteria bacterium]